MEYDAIWNENFMDLVQHAKEMVRKGWIPQGGIAFVFINTGGPEARQMWSQAFIKH